MKGSKLERIAELRELNYSYQFISDKLGMPMNTVKSICRRNGFPAKGRRKTKLEKQNAPLCLYCHRPLSDRRGKMFCSDSCRTAWWNEQRKVESNR